MKVSEQNGVITIQIDTKSGNKPSKSGKTTGQTTGGFVACGQGRVSCNYIHSDNIQ